MVFDIADSQKRPRRLELGYLDSVTAKLFRMSSSVSGLKSPVLGPRKLYSPFSSPTSSVSSSSSFWMPRRNPVSRTLSQLLPCITKRQFAVLACLFLTAFVWFVPPPSAWHRTAIVPADQLQLHPYIVPDGNKRIREKNPTLWLEKNSNNKHAVSEKSFLSPFAQTGRPRAALISLVRNSELEGISQSIRQLEYQWNRKYQYPWVFFNDEPFSDEFKAATRNLTSTKCYYELLPKEHWSLPDWIDEGRFMNSLEYLGAIGVGKGWMISYRHMCRWNSGFFYKHPRLSEFDWYWRVEPDVHFFCDIGYDVFRFMRDNNMKYGFNMNILDDARSFPSLWSRTRSFINAHPELIHPDADLDWLLDAHNGGDYNNCQFFSNFEIGSLQFFRGEANEKYFSWLDRGGGFYYERFGDAPIHTLSVAMFVPKSQIWYFGDIGYQHDINRHCPPNSSHRCLCEPTPIDENFYKLVPFESPQKKPADTCIRQFLGGDWLKKSDDWDQEAEKDFGGDGYHGYVLNGLD
ncbi:MAG: hypothetical protein M1839_004693 [Geoglossum umbratile]|nr:MAG: hypothetical protein M1839_004693 [Geoglossum umbratile]